MLLGAPAAVQEREMGKQTGRGQGCGQAQGTGRGSLLSLLFLSETGLEDMVAEEVLEWDRAERSWKGRRQHFGQTNRQCVRPLEGSDHRGV